MKRLTPFQSLWIAGFVSQTGAHLLTLALSAFLLAKTGSLLAATNVFVFSFLPGALFSAHLGRFIDQKLSRKLLVLNDIVALGLSLLCGWVVATNQSFLLLCLLLSLRSISTSFSRSAVMKWVRLTSSLEALQSQTQLIYLSFFLSTTFSGLMATFALGASSVWPVVALDVATYFISAGIFLFIDDSSIRSLPKLSTATPLRPHQYLLTLVEMLETPRLLPIVLIFVIATALFQGAYCILINYLPLTLSAGRSGVGWFQLAASVGILGGFALNRRAGASRRLTTRRTALTVFGLGIVGLFASTTTHSLAISLLAFFLFHFLYESIWLAAASQLVALSPAERVGEFQFVATSTALLLMSLWALIFVNITTLISPVWAVIGVTGFSAGLAILIYSRFGADVPIKVRVSA